MEMPLGVATETKMAAIMLNSNFETHCIMNKIINAIIALVSIGLFVACEDDQSYNENGVGREFTIGADTQFSGVESRAIFESGEVNITNYVFLLYGYDENVREATLLFSNEYTSLPVVERLPLPNEGEKYHAIMIANTTVAQLESLGITANSTLEKLFSATFDINTTDNKPTNAQKFTWSGYKEVLPDTRHLHFSLNPNLAKITVSVKNSTGETSELVDDIQIVNIQVRNVPNKARFAQNALSKAGFFTTADNATGVTDYIDYEIESLKLAKGASTTTPLKWYMPHNEAGNGTRPNNPAANATYIEVDGIRRLDFMDTAYKVYPGTDEEGVTSYVNLKNFNVKADYQYNFSMNITDDGLKYDGNNNVTDKTTATTGVDKVKLPYNSNCYMIHPLGSRSTNGTLYELPINRINEYWGSTYGINDASMQVDANTQWEAYVIWQDINKRAIYFADKDGNVNTTSTVYSGTGVTPIYFKLANQSSVNTSQTYGNILIGVRKKGSTTCLWSWHLWITDYNPDAALPYSVAKNVKSSTTNAMFQYGGNIDLQHVNIGNVQHYTNNKFAYWANFTTSHAAWNTAGGIYYNCWIMDRNIGAQDVNGWDADMTTDFARTQGFGLYYQFGRKDPFPYSQYNKDGVTTSVTADRKVYNINGTAILWNYSSSTTTRTIKEGIQNPNMFYATGVDWCKASNANVWNHPKTISRRSKSVFDPCPPGWCIPTFDAFEFFTFNPSYSNFAKNSYGHNYIYGYYNNYDYGNSDKLCPCLNVFLATNSANGSIYYNSPKNTTHVVLWSTGVSPAATQSLYIVYPLQGVLSAYDNGFSNFSKNCLWLSEPFVNDSGAGGLIEFNVFSGGYLLYGKTTANGDGSTRTQTITSTSVTNNVESSGKGYFNIYPGAASHVGYVRSRGQNIRCIQVPDGDTPKFYEEGN